MEKTTNQPELYHAVIKLKDTEIGDKIPFLFMNLFIRLSY